MTPFSELPLRRKLLAMVLATTTIVLLASCAILVAFDLFSLRRELARELGTLSDVIAANSSAALAFDAREDAAELLRTLAAEPSIVQAALYNEEGLLFASFGSAPARAHWSESPARSQRFEHGHLVTLRPVVQQHRVLGTLVVTSDLSWWYRRMWIYTAISIGVVALAFAAATAFSAFVRRAITGPVDELARVARAVSTEGDYRVRARRFGNDEFGALTDTFNAMLERIEQHEARLNQSEAERKLALEASGLGTWRYHRGTRRFISEGSLNRLLGLPAAPRESSWEQWMDRVHPEDRGRVDEAFARSLQTGVDLEIEYRLMASDGIRWVRDRGRCVEAGPEVAEMAGTLLDITERKCSEEEILRLNADLERRVTQRTAELEDSNRNLEAFAYSVSHDLRAPLRIISGYAEVLLEDRGEDLPPDHKLCLGRIVDGARKMNRLIDDLLQFSRLGQQPLKLQRTSMDRLVDEVIQDFDTEVARRQVEWIRHPLPAIECDPGLMRQVLYNLVSNALKYSRPRSPAVIEIGSRRSASDELFFVRDNGVGFDSSASTRLFGVFQRLHSAQQFEGNGVGLATAARIIRRHGGRIWAESQPDQGATFFVSLPLAEPSSQEGAVLTASR